LCVKLETDYTNRKEDIKEQANIIYNFKDFRSERVSWLKLTAFLYYIITLKNKKIWGLYKLSLKKELNTGNKNAKDPNFV
jgi:hypothetical protein